MAERKAGVGTHGTREPQRTPSGREVPSGSRGMPPPVTLERPTRVTRDSEDYSPVQEEPASDPFGDDLVDIPPTYHSLRSVKAGRRSNGSSGEGRISSGEGRNESRTESRGDHGD